MMAGARNVHDDIVVNCLVLLGTQLRGGPCRPFTGDGSVETLPGQIRRPDLGIDRGQRDPNGLKAAEPRLVVEVLSPGTRDFDTFEKLGEYKAVASLDHIVFVEPDAPQVVHWIRDPERNWVRHMIEDLDGSLDLPDLGVALALREIYEGVTFRRVLDWSSRRAAKTDTALTLVRRPCASTPSPASGKGASLNRRRAGSGRPS